MGGKGVQHPHSMHSMSAGMLEFFKTVLINSLKQSRKSSREIIFRPSLSREHTYFIFGSQFCLHLKVILNSRSRRLIFSTSLTPSSISPPHPFILFTIPWTTCQMKRHSLYPFQL
jgi:hypothetical protein